jgi:hypothetical protein
MSRAVDVFSILLDTIATMTHYRTVQALRGDFNSATIVITVAQWLRFCATNRKIAGSIPDGVNGFFL